MKKVFLGVLLFFVFLCMAGCVQPKVVNSSGETLRDAVVFILPEGDVDLPPTVLFLALKNAVIPRDYLESSGSYEVVAWAPGYDGAKLTGVEGENLLRLRRFRNEIVLRELAGGPATELSGLLILKDVFERISNAQAQVIWSNGTVEVMKTIYLRELDSVYARNEEVYGEPLANVPLFHGVINLRLFNDRVWVAP